MGKVDWSVTHYQAAQREFGHRPSIKISAASDKWMPGKNYARLVIYAHEGKFNWTNTALFAKAYSGKFAYVRLVCTDIWTDSDFRAAGQGRVHDKIFRETLGLEFREGKFSCGGFAIHDGVLKYSSIWLNTNACQGLCVLKSDNSKYLSEPEKLLVNYAVENWKAGNFILKIPDDLHEKLMTFEMASAPSGSGPIPLEIERHRAKPVLATPVVATPVLATPAVATAVPVEAIAVHVPPQPESCCC